MLDSTSLKFDLLLVNNYVCSMYANNDIMDGHIRIIYLFMDHWFSHCSSMPQDTRPFNVTKHNNSCLPSRKIGSTGFNIISSSKNALGFAKADLVLLNFLLHMRIGPSLPVMSTTKSQSNVNKEMPNDEFATLTLRNLLFDICNQSGGGHGGSAIGMAAIGAAMEHAKYIRRKPVFVNIRTIIGVGTSTAGSSKAHHGAIDTECIFVSKVRAGQDPNVTHIVPDRDLQFFQERKSHGGLLEKQWLKLLEGYEQVHPEKARQVAASEGKFSGHEELLHGLDSNIFRSMSTRLVLEKLWSICPSLIGGGADLVNSNKFVYSDSDFFHPSVS